MTKNYTVKPPRTESHIVSIDDDFAQRTAICSRGDFSLASDSREEKMAASYRHLAEVMERGPVGQAN